MEKYAYRHLASDRTIRVLTIHGGAFGDPIKCTIQHHELHNQSDPAVLAVIPPLPVVHDEPEYEALSWTWGEDGPQALLSLHVCNADRPRTPASILSVKPNLYEALQYLRKSDHDRYLWIDALCINQADDSEKAVQVAMMADIYKSAQNVCVWLGKPETGSQMALEFVSQNVADLGQYGDIINNPEFAGAWVALGALMIRPWFSRRWVVQEISLARHATVHCGHWHVTWYEFQHAVSLFERDAAKIAQLVRQSENLDPDPIGNVATMDAARLVHVTFDLFRRYDGTRAISEYKCSLSELVIHLTSFQAKKPHDMVYAVLALANDTRARMSARSSDSQAAQVFHINYDQPFVEVCKQFLAYTISRGGRHNLDIICRPWAPMHVPDLPSWITITAHAAFGGRKDSHRGLILRDVRPTAEPLVAATPRYNACGSWGQAVQATNRPGGASGWYFGNSPDTDLSLFVTGFVQDEIREASTQCWDGVMPAEWFRLAHWDPWIPVQPSGKALDPPESLWRTLVGDRDNKGAFAKSYYSKALAHVVKCGTTKNGDIDFQSLAGMHESVLGEFLERVKATVWNRRLFVSSRGDNLGLAPESARTGDYVCILKGCSVPVILRKIDQTGGQHHFTLIGECYLDTMMEGRAMEMRTKHKLEYTQFDLR
ncbi:hypothetical protein LTR85_010802 [Meristemomyces frigidus]|nr:hypothetical protein LTR85_010802 [Meristemomyces frigidus]